ncbi:MAG TPA: NfeD family protein [Gemmataceae bacterium]|nr:NfeD family protein [Gemmataceae bacterium]
MSIPVRSSLRVAVGVVCWVVLAAAPAVAQNAEGMFVSVPNPITTQAVTRIKSQISSRLEGEGSRPKPAVVIFDFNPGGKPASTADYGECYNLAEFILSKRGAVTTVAFVHDKVTGHTVLPVLACKEVVMSSGGQLGPVVTENVPALNQLKQEAYAQTLRDVSKTALLPLVQKMFDASVQLVRGVNPQGTMQFANAANEAEVKRLVGVQKVPGIQDAVLGAYPARLARDVGLCTALAESSENVCEIYGLPPGAGRTEIIDGPADVYRWKLTKEVDAAMRESVNRVIRDVRKKGGNVLILEIDCPGTDLIAARELADDLVKAQSLDSGEKPIQIIGFIPGSASPAGTVIALGCTDIVMYRPKPDADAKEAEIGDFSKYLQSAKPADADAELASIRELARLRGYPEVLIDGMFKKDLEIVRATGKTDKRFRRLMTREEFEKSKADWNEDKTVKPTGQLLKLSATAAAENGLARFLVEGNTIKDVTTVYGYGEAKDPDPGWLDKFAEFIRIPVVTVLLVVIGFTGLILELKVPGLTVPGIIAALCFILVFWAHSKFGGQTFVLAMLLFLLGLVLIGLEIFVLPGFGAPGIFGILCMLAGLGLVTLDRIPETGAEWGRLGERVSQYLFALMGAVGLAIVIARFLPKLPGASRLVLSAPTESATTAAEVLPGAGEAAELLGAIGTTNTPLRPAGVVKFGDKFVDVVSDGGFIPAGTRVQVIQVEGTRIVVKEV